MLVKLPLSDAQIGMFLVDVEDKGQRVSVTKPGIIKRREAIDELSRQGVVSVWVDPERFVEISTKSSASAKTIPSLKGTPPEGAENHDVDKHQALHLIDESKVLLGKVLEDVYQGKNVDIEPIRDLADGIVSSIMRNPDAIQCVTALRNKDSYLLEHSLNVAFLLVNFGRFLGFESEQLKELAVGGVLHDIGKIQIRDEVLHKPGRLTEEEFEHIKFHPVYSNSILEAFPDLSPLSKEIGLMHHEKLDGSGYPNGLKAEQITQVGRMSSIADIYDALTATRCYKEAMSPAASYKLMMSLTPHQLDPELLKKFIYCVGFYPVGSLVELSNGLVGLVWKSNQKEMTKPVIKCFYSMKFNEYRTVQYIDLAKSSLCIERGLSPSNIDVDPNPFR